MTCVFIILSLLGILVFISLIFLVWVLCRSCTLADREEELLQMMRAHSGEVYMTKENPAKQDSPTDGNV